MKFLHKILLACILSAVIPVGLTVGIILWLHPAWANSVVDLNQVLMFTALTIGLAVINALIAAGLLNRDFQQIFKGLRVALDQFARGQTPARTAGLPPDELGRLRAEMTERLSELAALRETTSDLTAELDMPRLLHIITERASALMGVSAGVIYGIDLPRHKIRLLAVVGLRPEPLGAEIDFGEGVVGRVAETGQSLVVHNYQQWPGRSPRFADYPLFDVLGVPLRWRGELLGVLNLEDEIGGRTFTERDVALAEQFAHQAATAIGNARLYERVEALHRASQAISRSLDLEQIFRETHQAVSQLMPCEAFAIALVDDSDASIDALYLIDHGARQPARHLPPGSGLVGHVIKTRQPLQFGSVADWPEGIVHFGERASVESVLAVPMQVGERIFGALATEAYERQAFTEEHRPLLVTVANQAAAAIHNAQLFQAAQNQLSQLSILHEVASAAISTADLDELILRALTVLHQRVGYDLLGLHLIDAQEIVLRLHPSFKRMFPDLTVGEAIPLGVGIIGQVARSGRARRVDDVREEATYVEAASQTRSELCVPLQVGERIIGVLNAEAFRPGAFGEADERLLKIVAGQLAPIIENARLYERDRRQLNELSLLNEIALATVSAANFEEGVAQAVQVLCRRLGYDTVGVDLIDESGEWLKPTAYAGLITSPEVIPIRVGEGLTGRALRSGQIVRVDDVAADPGYVPLLPGIRSELVVPLQIADRFIGVLNTESRQVAAYTDTDTQLLLVVAGMLAPIIDNARLRARAEQHARELDVLFQAQLAASASLDLEAVLNATVEALGRALDVTSAYVVEVSGERAMTVAEYYSPLATRLERVSDLRVAYAASQFAKSIRLMHGGQPGQLSSTDADVTEFEREYLQRHDGRAALVVPIIHHSHPLGYVSLWESRRDRVFSETERQLAQALAGHAAAAFENAKLYQAAQRRAEQMQLVNEVGRDISSLLEVNVLVAQVSQRLEAAFGYYHAKVGIIEDEALVFQPGFDPKRDRPVPAVRLRLDGPGLIAWVARNAQPRLTPDVLADPEYLHNVYFPETRSEVAVPLIAHGRLLGVLDVQSEEAGRLGPEDLATLEAISSQLAVAVDNAKLYAAARRRAEQMRLINVVGQDIAGLLEVEALLQKVGERLEESFGYYHANAGLVEGEEIIFMTRFNERRRVTIPQVRLRIDGPGLVAWAAKNAQPRLAEDVSADPLYMPYPFFPDTRAELILPLMVHDHVIGVLDVQSEKVRGLGPEDLTLLRVISGQLAIAIENARLYTAARRGAEEVSALLSTTLTLNSSRQLEQRLETIAQFARRLIEADSCTIYRVDDEAKTLRPIAIQDKYAEQISAFTLGLGEGITGYVALTGKGELLNRVELDPRGKHVPGTPLTPENLIAMPLKVSNRVTGVMAVYREGMRGFRQHDFNLIQSFAAQAAVAIESAELYEKLAERANSIQTAYDQLSEMDRLKDEMVQNVSHELRTPITFLKSYVDLLLSGQLGPLLPDQKKSLRVVADKTNTLTRLVNDIFTLQVVSAATLKKQPLDLVTLARAAADGVAASAQEAGLRFTAHLPELPVSILGDALRLSQVFDNLLGNAMKFTDAGGDIELNLRLEAPMVRVEVRDTGIGIATDKLNRIFDRFYQVDGTPTRKRGGIGLGLSICKQIVEAHGGHVGVESKAGRGACFFFILPMV